MMDVAQAVLAAFVVAVRRPPVMNRDSVKFGQHVRVVDRFAPTPGMRRVPGERLGRGAVNPAEPAGDPGASLIEMTDRRAGEQASQALIEITQARRGGRHPAGQRPGRHVRSDHIRQRLARPVKRQMLKDVEVHAKRTNPRPVLRRRLGSGRKLPAADMPALTAPQRRDVLDHLKRPLLGNVEPLPRLPARDTLGVPKITTTLIATLRGMLNTSVRDRDSVKPGAAVPFLPALLLTRALAQAPLLQIDSRLRETVRRRRTRAVTRIRRQPRLQLNDLRSQLDNQRREIVVARPPRNILCILHRRKVPCTTTESCPTLKRPE